ncbi:MAG TPA: type II toxin-antitoxin system VapC family toxin [Bryobacteraceae bacterium]|nr:type II toxin-antitoxin system VapC family toxin [Bryobacteraceae bacterium]
MRIYLDTSALAKLYHPEIGTSATEQLAMEAAGGCFVSRLGGVEMRSVLAQKVRSGHISAADSALALRRFRSDIRSRRFQVVSLRVRDYELAECLIESYGRSTGLRTLDSLHLAVALGLRRSGLVDSLVAADKILCDVALLEQLPVINPR